ncbi:beta-lactamase family protein [Glycomyces sp. A-F 0318]|uniref:serine hydrolase domain-containing protein n=1 Tax=Glycomyces amatae TaxID=2881355 RepID=UPI001E5CAB5D|nr:serine hydrolase domain-containing protein [Glycomyces amatae]MCD0443710.1 beta-lactamase family protein [Glycomyces amatae]
MNKPAFLLVPALALGAVLGAAPAQAQDEPGPAAVADLIDTRIAEILDEQRIPGAAATLIADGETVDARAYGDAVIEDGVEDGVPFATGTAFHTGSIAKLFTTAAALQLVEEGALDLDADVNDRLTGFAVPDTYPGEPITLRHLLTHTSGFEDRISGWAAWDAGEMPSLADFAAEQLPERLREPGTLVTYNNYDMVLAGVLIEAASGQPYADYVAEHVFAPLGMDGTRVVREEPATGVGAAEGYRYADGQVPTEGRLSPGTPAGPGGLTTAEDMGRFMTALLDGDPALGEGVAEQMTTRQFGIDEDMPGMGFSFQEFAGPGGGVWFKGGDVSGFHNALVVAPAQGVAFHVVFNGDGASAGATIHAAQELARDVLDALGALPGAAALEPGGAGDLDRYAGEYVSTRTTRSDFTEITRVFAPVTVEAVDGGLTTTGLSLDPEVREQQWVPVGDGRFQERDGGATIAFTADGVLLSSADPTVAYEPVPWYDGAGLHLAGLAFGALVLAAGFLALTLTAAVRLIRGRPRRPAWRIVNAWSSWLLGGVALAVLALLMAAVADANLLTQQVVTGSGVLTAALGLSVAAVGLTVVTAVVYAIAGLKRQWSPKAAVGQGLVVAGGAAFSAVLIALNLAAFLWRGPAARRPPGLMRVRSDSRALECRRWPGRS